MSERKPTADRILRAVEAVTGMTAVRYFRSMREEGLVPAGVRGPKGHHPTIGARETAQLLLAMLGGSRRRAAESISVLTSLNNLDRRGKVMFGDEKTARDIAAGVTEQKAGAALERILDRLMLDPANHPYLNFVAVAQAGDAYQLLVGFQKYQEAAAQIEFGALPAEFEHGLVTTRRIGASALRKIAGALGTDEETAK